MSRGYAPLMINDVLPPEVLSCIFETVLRSSHYEDRRSRSYRARLGREVLFDPSSTSIPISHVCSIWRTAAIENPLLWNVLHAAEGTNRSKVKTLLKRAKAAPLEVRIDIRYSNSKRRRQIVTWLPPLIASHTSHIRLLNIVTTFENDMKAFFEALEKTEAPLLEELWLLDESTSEPIKRYSLFNGPGSTPNLKIVKFYDLTLTWKVHSFQNLVCFHSGWIPEGTAFTLDEFVAFLHGSPLLEELSLGGSLINRDHIGWTFKAPSPVDLHALRTLVIRDMDTPLEILSILRLFHAPNLRELHLVSFPWGPDDTTPGNESIFDHLADRRDFRGLQKLKIAHVAYDGEDAAERLLCSLTELRHIYVIYDCDEVLRGVEHSCLRVFLPSPNRTHPLPTNKPCPKLEILQTSGVSGEVLIEVAKAKKGSSLTTVRRGFKDYLDGKHIHELKEMGLGLEWYEDEEYGETFACDTDSETDESGTDDSDVADGGEE